MLKDQERLQEFIKINEEVYEDYGWCIEIDDNLSQYNQSNIDGLKTQFIKGFTEKCCNNLILENTEASDLIQRVYNV